MGYILEPNAMDEILRSWRESYDIYAPAVIKNGGRFADTDAIRYKKINHFDEIVFDRKSDYSCKEVLVPITQTLFFFTEDTVKEADFSKKGAIIFLRSCDLHAMERFDEIYIRNGFSDYYYKTVRDKVKFVLMGCESAFPSCFCVDMGTNQNEDYDCAVTAKDGKVLIDNKNADWETLFAENSAEQENITPESVSDTDTKVCIPENLPLGVMKSSMWDEYDLRCANCGRCNFVCPTCTCFTMQDIFYTDNGKAGERRRVWASCMVDGFTDMAGNISCRKNNGQRLRYRVLHKISDYKKRTGKHMCVGCGRCDDICPEYISFSHCVNKLGDAVKEVASHDAQ